MRRNIPSFLVLIILPGLAVAAEPNMQPGQWEYTTTTRLSGAVNMPERKSSYSKCVTEGEVDEADAFLEDADECEIERREVSADRAGFALVCPGQQGAEMRMRMDMRLTGDRVAGETVATFSMSGEQVEMRTRVEGRRMGDC